MFSLTVQVQDAGGLTAAATITINLTDVNEVPTALNLSSTTVAELIDTTGGYSIGTLTTADPDAGETFTYTVVAGLDAALVYNVPHARGRCTHPADDLLQRAAAAAYLIEHQRQGVLDRRQP